jgi:hypothetical protein
MAPIKCVEAKLPDFAKIWLAGRSRYDCPIILDNSATVGSLPLGVIQFTLRQLFGELILGDACHLRQCLDDIGAKRLTKLTR